jgi:DUF4097 and DUF4098 domain-containing protein YvlB
MKILNYCFLIICTVAFNVWALNELSFEQEVSIAKNNAKAVIIDVGSGSLKVRGEDVDEISVTAKVYSKKYSNLEDLQESFNENVIFDIQQKGSNIIFLAKNKNKLFGSSNTDISIDVELVMPMSLHLEVDDGSGSIDIANIDGMLEVDDGSGSLVIHNIGANVSIDDGSGSIEINNVTGDVRIDDGSGQLKLTDINGSVYIEDGSGEINIKNVSNNVTVDDGSGSVKVVDLAGSFKLIDNGSGSIYVNNEKWLVND